MKTNFNLKIPNNYIPSPTKDTPNIIGVDPGGTCGIAIYNVRGFSSFHIPGIEAGKFITRKAKDLTIISPVIIACQRYIITPNPKTQQRTALHIIGELTAFARDESNIALELQNSADAAKVGSQACLEKLDWWKPGKRHANDAAKHVSLTMLRYFYELWYDLTHGVCLKK
jgi:hypothetical protein